MTRKTFALGLGTMLALASYSVADSGTEWHINFGPTVPSGIQGENVRTALLYDPSTGYGFEPDAPVRIDASTVATAEGPFLFSVRVPEGNYRVRVVLGGSPVASDTAVKVETRRVMIPLTHVGANDRKLVEFAVNLRSPTVDEHTSVKISDREKAPAVRHWDDKLTFEFCGQHPAVASISVQRVTDITTVFLAGDSTVCDQPGEPWAAWGQLLPQFFGPDVAVANYAESGRTLKSFKAENRLAKLLSVLKPNDYVFIQFGHNDMKEKGDGIGAFTSFSDSLREYVKAVRDKGGLPVLLTPMHRRKFEGNAIQPTFGDYPEAVRRVAAELKVPLIDLQAMSKPLYEAFGPEKSKVMFVWAPAHSYPNQDKDLKDDTHFRAFGAEQIARCVVQGMIDAKLPLAAKLRPGNPAFDPAKPNDPTTYDLPASIPEAAKTPEGR